MMIVQESPNNQQAVTSKPAASSQQFNGWYRGTTVPICLASSFRNIQTSTKAITITLFLLLLLVLLFPLLHLLLFFSLPLFFFLLIFQRCRLQINLPIEITVFLSQRRLQSQRNVKLPFIKYCIVNLILLYN